MGVFDTIKKIVVGDVAHDAADSGNPVKIGGKAHTSAPTAVANSDRVNAYWDANGRLAVQDGGSSLTVDGPLTNTELRASSVPVSPNFAYTRISSATVSANPGASYTAGDVVGGKLQLSVDGTHYAVLKSISIGIADTFTGTLAMKVIIFEENPSSTFLDDFQYSIGADAGIVCGVVSLPSTAFVTSITGGAVASIGNIDMVVPVGTIYAVIIAENVFDPGVDKLSIRFGFETD